MELNLCVQHKPAARSLIPRQGRGCKQRVWPPIPLCSQPTSQVRGPALGSLWARDLVSQQGVCERGAATAHVS